MQHSELKKHTMYFRVFVHLSRLILTKQSPHFLVEKILPSKTNSVLFTVKHLTGCKKKNKNLLTLSEWQRRQCGPP